MTEKPQESSSELSRDAAEELFRSLLHKEGNWVEWGLACQKLQKAGYSSEIIFEKTGFQSVQQNTIVVAAAVYQSLVTAGASEELLKYCEGPRSDILYELRILNREERLAAALLAQSKKLDADGAKEIARAVKEFSKLSQLPSGFSAHPGDAVAYQCWKRARQKKDLHDRSRSIARGLKFAHSQTAREKIEQLLSDFTVIPTRTAPLIPIHRLELEEELPRIIPVAGSLPLTRKDLETLPSLEAEEPFRAIKVSENIIAVPVPGWQVILQAKDPVGIFCQSDKLPKPLPGKTETVLVVVDRQQCEWNVNSYFLVEQEENLQFQWFEEAPNSELLAQVILVLRPKKILDENAIVQPWQMDD